MTSAATCTRLPLAADVACALIPWYPTHMSTPDEGAKRLGVARMRVLLAFARLNLAVLEHPTNVPDEQWTEITDAADELVEADTMYRTSVERSQRPYADPNATSAMDPREVLRRAAEAKDDTEGPDEPMFTLTEVLQIFSLWEQSARDNLEEARAKDRQKVPYFTGMVDALAHVRSEFERRGYQ